jgi:hypothetical protein
LFFFCFFFNSTQYTLRVVKTVALNSIHGAAVSEARRAEMLSLYQTEWDAFVDDLLSGKF